MGVVPKHEQKHFAITCSGVEVPINSVAILHKQGEPYQWCNIVLRRNGHVNSTSVAEACTSWFLAFKTLADVMVENATGQLMDRKKSVVGEKSCDCATPFGWGSSQQSDHKSCDCSLHRKLISDGPPWKICVQYKGSAHPARQ